METSANSEGFEFGKAAGAGVKKTGFLMIVRAAAKDVFGHLWTGSFWFNLAKRIVKVVAITATEAAFTAVAEAFMEAKGKVRKTVGLDEADPLLRGTGNAAQTPAAAAFTRPYQPPTTRTFSPTPSFHQNPTPSYNPASYPPAPIESWPGFAR